MLIAAGFELDNLANNLRVLAADNAGDLHLISREHMHRLGMPDIAGKTSRKRITTDFKDWRSSNFEAFLAPLEIKLPASVELRHQCFSFEAQGKTYLLPALVLMRGMFFPANVLLPTMFLPNALERACNFSWDDDCLTAELEPNWRRNSGAYRASHLTDLLTWLYAYPSAFKFASSLHSNAVRGALRMDLPQTLATLVLHSVQIGATHLVTKVALVEVQPMEEPQFRLAQGLKTICLHSKLPGADGREAHLADKFEVPLRSDGGFCLSDDEWLVIQNQTRTNRGPVRHDMRLLLDGVFEKLVTKKPWKQIEYKVGTWTNASALLQAWSKDGRFKNLLSELERLRTDDVRF